MRYQYRQSCFYRVPHDLKVDVKITMGDSVAHSAHTPPRYFRVKVGKLNVLVHHFGGSFADDNEAKDDSLLGAFVGKEFRLA